MTSVQETASFYDLAFTTECAQPYPIVDAFEQRMGCAIDRHKLESAARILACPLKAHAPNWQHGRVLYAIARQAAAHWKGAMTFRVLDIGTAKGFSALCLLWGFTDGGSTVQVTSLDVLDPKARVRRNTVVEVDGLKTLAEILEPWPEAQGIHFVRCTGQQWLQEHRERIHVAFVDGKHSYDAVSWEVALLAERQLSGDVAIFDDLQIAGVAKAIKEARSYDFEHLTVTADRSYAIGRRK